jgi:phage shock protein PspC (stress-responsive transcriptional regulator)
MTENLVMSPRLERGPGGLLGGVCVGLARTTGTSYVLWRVLFVVLSFFGGLGAALYLALWVALPAMGEQQSLAERLLHGPDRRLNRNQTILIVVLVLALAGALHDDRGLIGVLVAAGLVALWWRDHRRRGLPGSDSAFTSAAPAAAVPTTEATTTEAATPDAPAAAPAEVGSAPTAVRPPYQAPVWTPPPPRPRSVVTPLTLSVAALTVGVLLMVAAAGSVSIPTEVLLAVALGIVGLGLVASAFWGRARGLVPVAILLVLGLGGTLGARPALDHGVGERHWDATTTGSYRLGIGDGWLQLPASAADGGHVDARVTIGSLRVYVPNGVHAIVRADVTNGDIQGPGDVDENGRDVRHEFELGPKEAPVLYVDAHVGLGQVQVHRG